MFFRREIGKNFFIALFLMEVKFFSGELDLERG